MQSSDVLPWVGLALALGSIGCSARPTGADDGSGTSETETAPSSTSEAGSSATGGRGGTTTVGADSTGSSSDGGIDDGWPCSAPGPEGWHVIECSPDGGGVVVECDVIAQDCPDGDKCMPWANDGGSVWNAARCVPVVPAADLVGETCVVQGNAVTGLDTCALGLVCWGVDPVTLEGECVPVCQPDLWCEDHDDTCWVSNNGVIALCSMWCDPLHQDCADGHACMPATDGETFACVPPGGDALVAAGQPCESLNACEVGTACVTAQVLPACVGTSCCTSFCDASMIPSCADPTPLCRSWYEEGSPFGTPMDWGICVGVFERPAEGWLDPSLDDVEAATLP